MVKITLPNTLNERERNIAQRIINTRNGELRASKPPVPHKIVVGKSGGFIQNWQYRNDDDAKQGCAAYVWRMIAFYTSRNPQHQCMPCTAEFNLPGSYGDERRAIEKEMNALVDKIMDTIDPHEWAGVARWSKVLRGC